MAPTTPSSWSTSDHSIPTQSTRNQSSKGEERTSGDDASIASICVERFEELKNLIPLQIWIGGGGLPSLLLLLRGGNFLSRRVLTALNPVVSSSVGEDLTQQRLLLVGGGWCSFSGPIQIVHDPLPTGSPIGMDVIPFQVRHVG